MFDTSISFPGLGITIDPGDGFSVFGFEVKWYGVIIALGLCLAVFYGARRIKQFGLKTDDIFDVLPWALIAAVIGARLYYVVFEWDQFFGPGIPWYKFLDVRGGGLAIYGGVIGATIAIVIYTKLRKRKTTPYLDIMGLGLLIGQAVGRWGNFFNREAFGGYADNVFAMRINEAYGRGLEGMDVLLQKAQEGGYAGYIQVHPTFLYESAWNVVGFVLLHFLSKKRKFDGEIFLGYVAWYGLGRMLIEGLRTDSLYIGPLRASQWLAGITLLIAAGLLVYHRFFVKHTPEELLVNVVKAQQTEETRMEE